MSDYKDELDALECRVRHETLGGRSDSDLYETLSFVCDTFRALDAKLTAEIERIDAWSSSIEERVEALEGSVCPNDIDRLKDDLNGLRSQVEDLERNLE